MLEHDVCITGAFVRKHESLCLQTNATMKERGTMLLDRPLYFCTVRDNVLTIKSLYLRQFNRAVVVLIR